MQYNHAIQNQSNKVNNTIKRNGIYQYQRRIPSDLVKVAAFGYKRNSTKPLEYFRYSLGTRDAREARRLVAFEDVESELKFERKRQELDLSQKDQFIRRIKTVDDKKRKFSSLSAVERRGLIFRHFIKLEIEAEKYRLKDEFDLTSGTDYDIIGVPTTLDAAKALATDSQNDGRYQFQFWALSLVDAKPLGGTIGGRKGKKGSDKGIDGTINFYDGDKKNYAKVIVQVKSGKVKSGDIRDLVGTVEREKATLGVFITLENPSRDMTKEAVSAGYHDSAFWEAKYRKIQILTIEDLLDERVIDMPPAYLSYKQAQRIKQVPDQKKLL